MAIVDGHIRCHDCGEFKPLREFQPSVIAVGCGACRACKYAQKRAYERRNPAKAAAARNDHRRRNREQHRATMRAHYKSNAEAYRGYNLGRYGISVEEYEAILASQGGGCGSCGRRSNRNGKRLFVDHDHETGIIRGVLCLNCNRGIAAFGDNIDGVRKALAYLGRTLHTGGLRPQRMRINLLRASGQRS